MTIAEIFCSIQGEGLLAGTPSVFVRIGKTRCHWAGNVDQSWEPNQRDQPLGATLSAVRRHWLDHVVITGAEPMAEDGLRAFSEGLRGIDQHVTIETGGAVFSDVVCDLMSVSIDLAHPMTEPLGRLMGAYPYQLKVTLSDPDQVETLNHLMRDLHADRRRVVLMAGSGSAAKMRERATWILGACRCFGYRYSTHLQLDMAEKRRSR